jgi:hypothetical protein
MEGYLECRSRTPFLKIRWGSGRSIVGYLGRKLAGYPLSSIADYFRRDSVSLCQGMAKVEKRMREEDGFRENLMGLEKNLVEGRKIKIKK